MKPMRKSRKGQAKGKGGQPKQKGTNAPAKAKSSPKQATQQGSGKAGKQAKRGKVAKGFNSKKFNRMKKKIFGL